MPEKEGAGRYRDKIKMGESKWKKKKSQGRNFWTLKEGGLLPVRNMKEGSGRTSGTWLVPCLLGRINTPHTENDQGQTAFSPSQVARVPNPVYQVGAGDLQVDSCWASNPLPILPDGPKNTWSPTPHLLVSYLALLPSLRMRRLQLHSEGQKPQAW